MLVRLFGRNFRALKGPFELSMVAADLKRKEDRDRGVIEVPIAGADQALRLLRVAAIYGANASGKSTVLFAGGALNWLVTESSARSTPGMAIPAYEPFLLDDGSRVAPIELGCDVFFNKSLLRYETEFEEKSFLRETLTIFDENGETKLIDRKPPGEIAGELILRSDANRLYVQGMQPNVAVLSKLAQHGPRQGADSVHPYYAAIRDATRGADYSGAATRVNLEGRKDELFAGEPEYREWIMHHLIRAADVGICDVVTRQEDLKIPDSVQELFIKAGGVKQLPKKRVAVSFLHEGKSKQPIDFSGESSGTKKLFNIAGDMWALAHAPITLLADELSAGLHPRLLDGLIRAVNDVPSDGVRSQLIFATHDTGLLEGRDGLPPALRRDQVYFTKKDANGAAELYPLIEFNEDARPVHNIRKRYMSGLYGAIPSVDKFSL